MAISAIVPLNGFVSEWLTLQAFFLGVMNSFGGYKIFMALCAALLALTGGLAASCFVKAFGITFLALPRSQEAEYAHEAPLSMRIGMGLLALAWWAGLAPLQWSLCWAVSGRTRQLTHLSSPSTYRYGLLLLSNNVPTLVISGLLISTLVPLDVNNASITVCV
jgi:formate hydrogenlyase subunit 3/multisubunit Na+/H+ antiporter MnhD subunit